MTKQSNERQKSEASNPKHDLMDILSSLDTSTAKGRKDFEQLEKIIIKLEVWQNR